MFENITREQFRIDTVLPAAQTLTAVLGAQLLGRLGHYSVSAQSTFLLSVTASLVSSLANNFFTNKIYQYLALVASIGAGLAAHRIMYPANGLNALANAKEIAIIAGFLVTVKLIADNLHRIRSAEEKVKDAVVNAEKNVEKKVVEGASEVVDKVKDKLDDLKKEEAKK